MQIQQPNMKLSKIILIFFLLIEIFSVKAQDNYVIEVHGTEPNIEHDIVFQLHGCYVLNGVSNTSYGTVPWQHLWCSALEFSHWFSNNFESSIVAYYAIGDNNRTNYTATHLHNLLILPKRYKLPFGVGVVADLGFQNKNYFADGVTLEVAPIVDKQFSKLYAAINFSFVKSFDGYNKNQSVSFSPSFKVNYLIHNKVAPGIEYYSGLGTINNIGPLNQQQHQVFVTLDGYNIGDWILNFGYGFGISQNTDKSLFKLIIGRKNKDKYGYR